MVGSFSASGGAWGGVFSEPEGGGAGLKKRQPLTLTPRRKTNHQGLVSAVLLHLNLERSLLVVDDPLRIELDR